VAFNTTHVAASVEDVFAVLADPASYAHWVVGSRKVDGADPGFPAPGTRFSHQIGVPPLVLSDETVVLESDPPRRLVLRTKVRMLGSARVELRLEPERDGTRVTMRETAASPRTHLLINPLTDPLVHLRNAEALRRLRRLAERG
jgi:uncharacterized protein YndB with AHSA1/START domain